MNDSPRAFEDSVTLDTCASEPIHIPGCIQPHGALLAFKLDGSLDAWSVNVGAVLNVVPVPGSGYQALALNAEVVHAIHECIAEGSDGSPFTLETAIEGQEFDVIVHRHASHVIAEFERRALSSERIAAFALEAHRVNDRLRRQQTTLAVLEMAVEQVRRITGFDRVMAYQFRADESGDVVAESRSGTLAPYLGLRFPASDIPAQARRLYTINTLRLIADTHYVPVPLSGRARQLPLDMSHCVLRSVSPIHIEYLHNMGAGASMSVSIVVNGRLWGMLACHHGEARQVPYLIRIACDVMAHVIAAAVQSLAAVALAEQAVDAALTRTRFIDSLFAADDILGPLIQHVEPLRTSFGAEAAIICQGDKVLIFGDLPEPVARLITKSLPDVGAGLLERTRQEDWPQAMQAELGKWVGLLGLCFDPESGAWLLLLRADQVETVRWGGNPEKQLTQGTHGSRLSPRTSFEEWKETMRIVEPWSRLELGNARQLLGEMHRARNARHTELDRTRNQLLAMLGHDLRDPLNSISMAATVLTRGDLEQKLGHRILSSSGRMQRLINQVLDVSRVQNGLGLGLARVPVDLAGLIADIVDETQTAHPQMRYEVDVPDALFANIDSDRIAQLLSNLLNNARHHGKPDVPVLVTLHAENSHAVIRIRNQGEAIDPATAATLYDPFKRPMKPQMSNRSGLGLGLYIARAIVVEHAGVIRYGYEIPHVVFTVELPLAAVAPGTSP